MKVSHNIDEAVSTRPMLSVEQTAELYHVGKRRIKSWIKAKPTYEWYFKNGRAYYIWREKFEDFIQQFRDVDEIGA